MKETVVTVRMPKSLISALNDQVFDGHYLDFSEAVRSIVRSKYLKAHEQSLQIKITPNKSSPREEAK